MSQLDSCEILPQFGFKRPSPKFKSIVHQNRLLFRVFDDSSKVRYEDVGFAATRYAETTENVLKSSRLEILESLTTHDDNFQGLQNDVIHHLDWSYKGQQGDLFTRSGTPYVSMTLSLMWAIHGANRREKTNRKNIKIAVIDGRGLEDYAEICLRLLEDISCDAQSNLQAERFANAAQEVLAFAYVPHDAICRIVIWDHMRAALPFWFKDLQRGQSFKNQLQAILKAVKDSPYSDTAAIHQSIQLATVMLPTPHYDLPEWMLTELVFHIYVGPRTSTDFHRLEEKFLAPQDGRDRANTGKLKRPLYFSQRHPIDQHIGDVQSMKEVLQYLLCKNKDVTNNEQPKLENADEDGHQEEGVEEQSALEAKFECLQISTELANNC